jgi:hypothetical protein
MFLGAVSEYITLDGKRSLITETEINCQVFLARKRNLPTERPPLIGEISAKY